MCVLYVYGRMIEKRVGRVVCTNVIYFKKFVHTTKMCFIILKVITIKYNFVFFLTKINQVKSI